MNNSKERIITIYQIRNILFRDTLIFIGNNIPHSKIPENLYNKVYCEYTVFLPISKNTIEEFLDKIIKEEYLMCFSEEEILKIINNSEDFYYFCDNKDNNIKEVAIRYLKEEVFGWLRGVCMFESE